MNVPKTPGRIADDPAIREQLSLLRQQQDRLFAELADGHRHFRQLARSVWRVQEDERRRLARELHDGLGQNLTVLKQQLEQLAQHASAEARAPLAAAHALCTETLEDTRALSRMLRPQILDDLGLEPALRWLARTVAASAEFRVEVDCNGLPPNLDGDLSTLLFRVSQEALTNVAKHAKAQNVLLRAHARDSRVVLLIADDGVGCQAEAALARSAAGASTGLGSIGERIALFGGRLQFLSGPGDGTQVRVTLPLITPVSPASPD